MSSLFTVAACSVFRYAVKGSVKVSFVGIEALKKADADTITAAVRSVLDRDLGEGKWQQKLVAIASDGAVVMTGIAF